MKKQRKPQASPTKPPPETGRRAQLTRILQGLAQLEKQQNPVAEGLQACTDAVGQRQALAADSPLNLFLKVIDNI